MQPFVHAKVWKEVLKTLETKIGQLGMSRKGRKKVAGIQSNAPSSLIHFMQLQNKVNCMALDVSGLFLPFVWHS